MLGFDPSEPKEWVIPSARSFSDFQPIIRGFIGDLNVVHVAFTQACVGDADEAAVGLHVGDGGAAGVAHGGAEAAD